MGSNPISHPKEFKVRTKGYALPARSPSVFWEVEFQFVERSFCPHLHLPAVQLHRPLLHVRRTIVALRPLLALLQHLLAVHGRQLGIVKHRAQQRMHRTLRVVQVDLGRRAYEGER